MIPIIWRYLFQQYIKVLALCATSFIIILMTIRLNDIANFASFGASGLFVLRFAFNQMACLLPYALPISCFLSAILLIQRLSKSHELTALRAAGFSFAAIFFPILLTAVFLAGLNFILVSEAATWASRSNYQLKEKLRAINPLVLLHNRTLMGLKGIHFFPLGPSKIGEYANDAVVAVSNQQNTRLHLMLAKTIEAESEELICEQMTLITNMGGGDEKYDQLLIENVAKATTPSTAFSILLQNNPLSQSQRNERLQFHALLRQLKQEKEAYSASKSKDLRRLMNRSLSEIARRFSSGFSVLTFTFMGLAFGATISRQPSRRNMAAALLLLAIYLVTQLMAKEIKDRFIFSLCLYAIPHLLILLLSYWTINRIARGIEA